MHEKQFAELRDRYIKARSRAEKDEVLSKLQSLMAQNPEDANKFFEEGLGDLYEKVGGARVKDELAGVLSIVQAAYIAKEYFGKSGSWFSQKLNGHKVGAGRAYFTHAEVLKIQEAIRDIGSKLSAFTFPDDVLEHD